MKTLYGILHVSLVLAGATGLMWTSMEEVFGPYRSTLTHRVGRSPLVVVGTVTDKQSLWRDNGPTTDFTIEVSDIIKGTPNAGTDTVKFMVPGGTAIDPRNGKQVTRDLEYQHNIEIDDQVLFFFSRSPVEWRNKTHPYQGLYLHPKNKVPIDNSTVTLGLLGGQYPDVMLHIYLVVALGKATVIDRETAIHEVMMEQDPNQGPVDFSMQFVRRLMFTCENLLDGYAAGVNAAMEEVRRGEHNSIVTVSSQTFAEERGYCRGFVDTIKHHFDVDYYCICDRHWSYQIKRPEK